MQTSRCSSSNSSSSSSGALGHAVLQHLREVHHMHPTTLGGFWASACDVPLTCRRHYCDSPRAVVHVSAASAGRPHVALCV
mmetsp:Transcript_19102/g.41200  ORF Transcript_19102/g.41200 Transcript_19102/m.41200 type:complete len:81 (+) Transcript_19102:358-600(+)